MSQYRYVYLFYAFVANAMQGWTNKRYVYLFYVFVANAVQGWTNSDKGSPQHLSRL